MSRPGVAAQALGIAAGALDEAVKYSRERRQFGKPICSFQGIQFMLADMATQVEAARALVYQAARYIDSGAKDISKISAMCKLFASDVAMKRDHRRRAGLRRLRLHEGISGREDDARRQDHADLRRHQPDPARSDRR